MGFDGVGVGAGGVLDVVGDDPRKAHAHEAFVGADGVGLGGDAIGDGGFDFVERGEGRGILREAGHVHEGAAGLAEL
jgi:hypothetical protein